MGQLEAWASLVAQLVKKSSCIEGDLGLIIGFGRSPGGGKGYPLQYSSLKNSTDCIVPGVGPQSGLPVRHYLQIRLES